MSKDNNASPGDIVKIHTKEEIVKGTLLPRSKLMDDKSGQKITVLKLENGYNIGIDNSKIKQIELVKKYVDLHAGATLSKQNPKLPNVLIISCGGTISSKVDYKTGGVYADYSANDFVNMLPELKNIANISALNLMGKMSEDFLPEDWTKMAKSVQENYDEYDGFVLTQGTDTMHYSTAALSFFLKNLGKPVLFTAAQRSIDRGSSDAFMNLVCSVKAAAYLDMRGVFLCMHANSNDDYCYIHKGTKVRKMSSLRRDAFRSINAVPVAKVNYLDTLESPSMDIEILEESMPSRSVDELEKVSVQTKFEDKTGFLYFHPNMDPGVMEYYVDKDYKGLVIAGTALGHVALNGKKSLEKVFKKAKAKGMSIVMTTQCFYGRVDPLVYSSLRRLSIEFDVIFAEDILPETAYIKLGWVLGQTKNKEQIKEMMLSSVAHEISEINHPDAFLN